MTNETLLETTTMRMVFPHQSAGRWMDELATDMGTIVETLFGELPERERSESGPPEARPTMSVPMDIDESKTGFTVTLDVPGVALESIELEMHEDTLMIRGERVGRAASTEASTTEESAETKPPVDAQPRRRERVFGRFQRVVRLPLPVENDSVSAEMSDGVLVVTLPKADPDKGKRRVPVKRS